MFSANDTPEANNFEMVDQERKPVEREMYDGGMERISGNSWKDVEVLNRSKCSSSSSSQHD